MSIKKSVLASVIAWSSLFAVCASAQTNIGSAITSSKSNIPNYAQTGPAIVIDQFGYLPQAKKIAVLRSPEQGFDSAIDYPFGSHIELIDSQTKQRVMKVKPKQWNDGKMDVSSGDKVMHADFSALNQAGRYFLYDPENNHRSFEFEIHSNVYREVLKEAFRVFFYQRAGFAKQAPFADPKWADAASHMQDKEARLHSVPLDADTRRDLRGGWYDAGDYNKYTNWTADYIIGLLSAYIEHPPAWTDDFNIPESGNGIPDIIDEISYGLTWLTRMQNEDGSMLSIVGLDEASPPSAAKGPSYYGPANTSATLTSAAAFAFAGKQYAELGERLQKEALIKAAKDYRTRAIKAWQWALEHPNVVFKNNDEASGSKGLGAGQQEVDDSRRARKKMIAAIYLFALTEDKRFLPIIDSILKAKTELYAKNAVIAFRAEEIRDILYFASLQTTPSSLSDDIKKRFAAGMLSSPHNIKAHENVSDPYFAYLLSYTWGSNAIKANQGSLFYELLQHNIDHGTELEPFQAALHYLHYMHGVNPLGKVYLSNMYHVGAENSVNEFYHAWFKDGSQQYEHALLSPSGPAPGFVVGGPNPNYNWDDCCPNNCRSAANNAMCGTAPLRPPFGAFDQKAYLDFNTSWPINSWEVTENSNKYQTNYLRLLSKFVNLEESAP